MLTVKQKKAILDSLNPNKPVIKPAPKTITPIYRPIPGYEYGELDDDYSDCD